MTIKTKSTPGGKKAIKSKIPNVSRLPSEKTQQKVEKKLTNQKTKRFDPSASQEKSNTNRKNAVKGSSSRSPNPDPETIETQIAVLDALLKSSDNILSIVDRNYRLINFNHHFVDIIKGLYGKIPQISFSLQDFYTNEKDWKTAKSILDRVLAGESVEMESLRGDKPDQRRKFRATYSPVLDKKGAVVGVITRAHDITTQWKLERDKQHMEEILETVTKGTRMIICSIDMDYHFTYFNSAYQDEIVRLTGKKIHIGMSMLEALARNSEQQKTARGEWAIVLGGQSTNRTVKFPDSTGNQIIYSVMHTPLKDDQGHQVGAGEVAFDITQQMKMEEVLQESEEKYRLLYEHNMDGIILTAPTGEIFAANEAARKMFQRTEEEICRIGRWEVVDRNDPRVLAAVEERRRTGKFFTEMTCVKADGTHFEAEVSSFIFTDSHGNQRTSMIVRDITDRKKREIELARLNRTLRALSNSSLAILRAKDSTDYMQQVCRIIMDDCQYTMVWIGLAENDDYKTIRPAAYAGFEEGYLDTLKITWADTPRGHGPTGTAVRTGKVTFCRNMLTDPKFEPWRAEAIKRGYASSMAIPMKVDGKIVGAITIYSREPDPFSTEEVTLLEELTSDFSFGLSSLQLREENEKGEAIQAWLASFPEKNPQPIVEVDEAGKIYYQNPAAKQLLPDLLKKGKSHPWLIHLDQYFEEIHAGKISISSAEVGLGEKHFLQNITFFPGEKRIRIYGTDITAWKKAEATQAWMASFPDIYPWPIVEVDSKGKVFYQNPACRRMFPDLEEKGKHHPWLRNIGEYFQEAQGGKSLIRSKQIEVEGSHFLQFNNYISESGRVRIYSTDISERVYAEEMQAWLASFPDIYPWPIVEVDSAGKVYYQNPACRALFPDLEEKGKSHPWLGHLNEYFDEAQGGSSAISSKEINVGGAYYLQINNYIEENKSVRIYGMDISSRKQAEAAQAWLASFPDNYPWPIVEVDSMGQVFYQNPACRTMFPDLEKRGKAHPWLRYIEEYFKEAHSGASEIASRQIPVGDSHFLQINYLVPEADRVRIYGTDISKRVQAEEMQAWLASFPDNYPWPIVEVDSEGKMFYQNHACRILFPDLEEKGRSHPWLSNLNEYFEEAQGGTSAIPSKEIKAGGTYYLQINNYIVENKRVRIYGTDISSRKRAEAAQAWLASFPDNYPWPIVEVDADGRVFYQNPACRAMFPDLVEKGKAHPWLCHIGEYFEEAEEGESLIASRQVEIGDSHFLQTNNYIPESGRVRIYATDISKRVQAEENRDRLAAILESTPDMVATFTLEGKVLYLNKAGRDTLGLPPDVDFSNYRISPHMPQWSTQLITKEAFPEVLRTGVWAGETMILDKNGKEIPISQSILAHRESNGEIAFLSTVARDISQRKQIEDALIQSGAELEQRVKERTQELNESHEKLRQQIEERQRLADSLHDAVNQSLFSAGLIAEVLPRLWERDQVEARKSLQDLRRLTRGAQAEMRALLNELRPSMIADNSLDYLLGILAETFSGRTNIPVSLSTPKNVKLPDEVKTVYYRVCQEALNNVAKHANASQVQIRLTQHDGFTDLQISDNGCGFDPDDANISHYGLGMIRERMNSIHGQLSVESKKSKGCMIHIHWSEKDAREEE